MGLDELGPDGMERASAFLRPLFIGTYGDKVAGGEDGAGRIFDAWDSPEALEAKRREGVRYFMLSDDGEDLCLLALRILGDGMLYLDKLYVADAARGRGLGSRGMEYAFRFGREHGCDQMLLHSNASNADAIGFYGRFGLHPVMKVHRAHDGSEYDYALLVGPIGDRGRASPPSTPARSCPEGTRLSPPSRRGRGPAGPSRWGSTWSGTLSSPARPLWRRRSCRCSPAPSGWSAT